MYAAFFDLTLWQVLSRLVAFMIVCTVHGFALAMFLRLSGDPTPGYHARLSPDPFRHLSLLGLVAALVCKFGWIVPMPLDQARAHVRPLRTIACVLASLLVVLALVPVLIVLRPLAVTTLPLLSAQTLLVLLDHTQEIAIWFVAFNVVPLPPLTGFLIVAALWPRAAATINKKPVLAEVVMLALALTGIATRIVTPIHDLVLRLSGT